MIPISYLIPCLWALNELVQNYNVSVLFCTATQPSINGLLPQNTTPVEIAPNPRELYDAFRRVHIRSVGDLDDNSLGDQLAELEQVLCIVNTRNHAASLYEHIRGPGTYHLSARMYPAHRSRKLKSIRESLRNGEICRVVSTQLIEAGVDVDFPIVYRAIAGLDSIAQAAGRCNREGRLKSGDVIVFRPEANHQPRGRFQRTAAITEMVLRRHNDLLALEAIDAYFRLLYEFEGEKLDEHQIIPAFNKGAMQLAFPFREVDANFQLIDSPMTPIIIPRDTECTALMEEARWKGPSMSLSRRFQPFIVQVYQHEFVELSRHKAIEVIGEQYTSLTDLSMYDEEVGLKPTQSSLLDEPLIF